VSPALSAALLCWALSILFALATVVCMIAAAYFGGMALVRPDARRHHPRRAIWCAALMVVCAVLSALARRASAALAAAA
jgi:hypothetical protein